MEHQPELRAPVLPQARLARMGAKGTGGVGRYVRGRSVHRRANGGAGGLPEASTHVGQLGAHHRGSIGGSSETRPLSLGRPFTVVERGPVIV